jgi:hypothetical protein
LICSVFIFNSYFIYDAGQQREKLKFPAGIPRSGRYAVGFAETRDPPAMGPRPRPGGNPPWGSRRLITDYPNLLTAVPRQGEWGIGERT